MTRKQSLNQLENELGIGKSHWTLKALFVAAAWAIWSYYFG